MKQVTKDASPRSPATTCWAAFVHHVAAFTIVSMVAQSKDGISLIFAPSVKLFVSTEKTGSVLLRDDLSGAYITT